jgi:hypothetical protein
VPPERHPVQLDPVGSGGEAAPPAGQAPGGGLPPRSSPGRGREGEGGGRVQQDPPFNQNLRRPCRSRPRGRPARGHANPDQEWGRGSRGRG